MAQRIRANANLITHDNYSAVVSPGATKSLPANCTSVLIHNLDSSITISVSFDGGSNWKQVLAGAQLSLDVDSLASYKVKSASSTPSVECLYGSEA